jgi:hypothetical protein
MQWASISLVPRRFDLLHRFVRNENLGGKRLAEFVFKMADNCFATKKKGFQQKS